MIATVLDERHAVERLVQGVTAQLRAQDELVVVDGGSRDGTYERLLEHADRDGRVRVLLAPAATSRPVAIWR